MELRKENCHNVSEEGVLHASSSVEDLSGPVSYHNQWVLKGLPAWAHAGLPHGWTKTTHQSGLPLYYHRESRVVVLCKPYQLGNADLKTHKIPVSAIPCMFYDALCNKKPLPCDPATDEGPSVDVQLFNATDKRKRDSEAIELGCLSENQVRSYCKNKFDFECVRVPYFRNFSAKCKYRKELRKFETKSGDDRQLARGDSGIPDQGGENDAKMRSDPDLKRPFHATKEETTAEKKQRPLSEPDPSASKTNENYTCQLHTVCSKKLGCCLSYESLPPLSDQPDDRYRVMVKLGSRQYCYGSGRNRKAAKMEAARKTLLLLNDESAICPIDEQEQAPRCTGAASTELADEKPRTVENEHNKNEDISIGLCESSDAQTENSDFYEGVDESPGKLDDVDGAAEDGSVDKHDDSVGRDRLQLTSCSRHISQQALDLFSRYDINSEMIYDLCQTVSCPSPYALLRRIIFLDAFQFRHGLQEEVRTFSGRIHVKLICRRYKAVTLEDRSKKWFVEKIRGENVSMKNKEEGRSRAAQKIISKLVPSLKTYADALLLLQNWEVLVEDSNCNVGAFGKRLGPCQRDKCQDVDWHLLGEINSELRNVCNWSDKPHYLFEF